MMKQIFKETYKVGEITRTLTLKHIKGEGKERLLAFVEDACPNLKNHNFDLRRFTIGCKLTPTLNLKLAKQRALKWYKYQQTN